MQQSLLPLPLGEIIHWRLWSFHYKPLASTGDFETGEVLGEYTLELRNENAHGIIRGLKTA